MVLILMKQFNCCELCILSVTAHKLMQVYMLAFSPNIRNVVLLALPKALANALPARCCSVLCVSARGSFLNFVLCLGCLQCMNGGGTSVLVSALVQLTLAYSFF